MKKMLTVIFFTLPLMLWAQTMMVTGTVKDAGTGKVLVGANVVVERTSMGAATDASGSFTINNVPAESKVTASMIGYGSQTLSAGAQLEFSLAREALDMTALEVLSSRSAASAPVAYTNIKKADMELRLGSRDLPLMLNTIPSVFATGQGGGAGDVRINIRGFDQRNFAVMINGVPVNDIENGWVYWSNWDGVGDATSSIQVQRGMSAVNLAVPSIGGTVNIVTDPAALEFGAKFKQEIGSYGFMKSTASFNSGKVGNHAFSGALVKKTGEGYYKGTFTDAYAFYFASSMQLNDNNKFELYAVGAPQRHGHNLYKQNIAVYDTDLAKELGYTDPVIAFFEDKNLSGHSGRDYNQNYISVPDSMKGNDSKQYFEMYSVKDGIARYNKSFLMERENFFHKPQVNLNWYSKLSDDIDLSTVFYWSGGSGGGTGTYGSPQWDYSGFSRVLSFADTWEENQTKYGSGTYDGTSIDSTYSTTLNRSDGILRNSVNQQSTIGLVSKLDFKIDESLKMQVGVDLRKAEVGHWREVRDLIGGGYYVYTDNDFDDVWDYHPLDSSGTTIIPASLTFNDSLTNLNHMKKLGDKIAYHNTNTIGWRGFYWQGEYSGDKLDLLGVIGFSTVGYTYVDHFTAQSLDTLGNHGSELFSFNRDIGGSQLKLGASYNLFGNFRIYSNYADVSKVPNFDGAINDYDGSVYTSPKLERFLSREYGIVNQFQSGHLRLNYYNTDWLDRSRSIGVVNADGSDGYVYLSGIDAKHTGIEGELALRVNDLINLRTSLAINDWSYQSNPSGFYNDYGAGGLVEYTYYLEGLKVGNQPQYQHSVSLGLSPMRNLNLDITSHYYGEHYADWDPFSRSDPTDNQQSWRIPDYHLLDLHFSYKIMDNLQLVGHIFNLLDKTYVQEATDNDGYNAYNADGVNHSANDASVFLGLPRRFNISLTYSL
jgi:outer membrane cobalamin receptor